MESITVPPSQPRASTRSHQVGLVAVVLATACWGTSGLNIKLFAAETDISALSLAFWRDITTFLVLLAALILLRPAWLRVDRHDLPWMVALGGSLGVFHVMWNLGVFVNGVAVATVQQAAMPAIVTLAAWVLWQEELSWGKALAIALTFAGTVLVSGLDALGVAKISPMGLLIGLGIPMGYAAWTLLGKKFRAKYNQFTLLTYAFACAALVLLPAQFFTPQPWPIPSSAWIYFAGLIGISTILGFSLYLFALGRMQAGVVSILAMTEIAFGALYAYLLLGERLTPIQILGALLVIAGVLWLSLPRRLR